MVSVKVGIDGNTSRSLRHQEHTCHYGMMATLQRNFYRLGQGELCTLIVIDTKVDSNITPVEESTGLSVFIL